MIFTTGSNAGKAYVAPDFNETIGKNYSIIRLPDQSDYFVGQYNFSTEMANLSEEFSDLLKSTSSY
jgi:hypothetical protein